MKLSLSPVRTTSDLAPEYKDSPIADLFRFHDKRAAGNSYSHAPLLIVTCMDRRIALNTPPGYAYVVRTAGANTRSVLFNIDYAVAVAKVEAIALIGHNDCAMTRVKDQRTEFEQGMLTTQDWAADKASRTYDNGCEWFGIDDAVVSTWKETHALRKRYPNTPVAPLYYLVKDGRLVQIVAE